MRNLLNFLLKYSSWSVFIILATISLLLIYKNNSYQRYVFLTSANSLSSSIYKATSNVTGYFNLREINDDLNARQASLETEIILLRKSLENAKELLGNDSVKIKPLANFQFITAHVINNSIHRDDNYITIEKGESDGVKPQMGVIDQNGIVGIVDVVSSHAARVISMLNSNFKLSCKVKNTSHFGALVWDGKSTEYAVLTEMPSHVMFHRGDTVVTSGYSAVFPPDIPVGIIETGHVDADGNFSSLNVRIFTDFTTLSTVKVISSPLSEEINKLENPNAENDK